MAQLPGISHAFWPVFGLLALLAIVGSQATAQDMSKASTSAQDRNAALRSIPFDELTPETRAKLWPVVSSPDIYRRLPVVSIDCDPDLYLHMIRHPEVVVNIWHLMGITQVEAQRVAPYVFDAADGAGTMSRVELVYGTPNLHVMYGEGEYDGPLLMNRITGKCVIVLRSDYYAGATARPWFRTAWTYFWRLISVASASWPKRCIRWWARRRIITSSRPHASWVVCLGLPKKTDPGLQKMAQRLEGIDPAVRQEFSDLALLTHRRAAYRLQQSGTVQQSAAIQSSAVPGLVTPTAAQTSSLMESP